MRKRILNTFFALGSAAFLLSGCQDLCDPGGKAPDGPIVKPAEPGPKILSEKAAVNYMVTALSTQCAPIFAASGEPPSVAREFSARSDNDNELAEAVFAALAGSGLAREPKKGETAAYILRSEIKDSLDANGSELTRWEMSFLAAGAEKTLWNKTLLLNQAKDATPPSKESSK